MLLIYLSRSNVSSSKAFAIDDSANPLISKLINSPLIFKKLGDRTRWGEKDNFKVVEEDFLIQIGVNWEGNLQFIKDNDKILLNSTFSYAS